VITLTMQGAGWRVETVNAADESGNPVAMRVLVVADPQSGIMVHVPLALEAADEIAAALRGTPGRRAGVGYAAKAARVTDPALSMTLDDLRFVAAIDEHLDLAARNREQLDAWRAK
jgi:hypothetical protein